MSVTSIAERRRLRLSLTQQIMAGLVVGVVVDWLFPHTGAAMRPVGQLFLRLIKMIVGPLVLTTLVAGWPARAPGWWGGWA